MKESLSEKENLNLNNVEKPSTNKNILTDRVSENPPK